MPVTQILRTGHKRPIVSPHELARPAIMLTIEIEREAAGRWIGEVPELPGVIAYGATEDEARNKAAALALRVIADRIEHGEPAPIETADLFATA